MKPYEHNARRHAEEDIATIKNSIKQFQFSDPIGIWGPENLIVEGHGRLIAAKELGMKEKHNASEKWFGARAILSSLVGKYVDGFIFTFLGLSFLPLETKIIMVLNCPFIQVCIETAVLPITTFIMKKVKKAEAKGVSNDCKTGQIRAVVRT